MTLHFLTMISPPEGKLAMLPFLRHSGRGAELPSLKIPQAYVAGFKIIAEMPNPAFTQLLAAANAAPSPFATVGELRTWLTSEAKFEPRNDVGKIVDSISSASRLLSMSKWNLSTLVPALEEAARSGIDNFRIADGADFKQRLTALLSLPIFSAAEVKAKELQEESERLLLEARILTDLRPVFGEGIAEGPDAFIVTHTLKLHYWEAGKHKDFFVALDRNDVRSLKEIAERAEKKSARLTEIIDLTGVRHIEPTGDKND